MKIKKIKLISLFLVLVLALNNLLALPAFAQAARTGVTPSHPANKTKETLLTESFPTFASVNPSFPALDTQSRPTLDSAFIRSSPIVQKLLKKQYRSGEDISFAITNPQADSLSVSVVDSRGQQADVAIAHMPTGNGTMYDVAPRAQFRPGKYKLVVTDTGGRRSEQDFSWGVLSINSDRSVYLPGQTADLSIAVLDDGGNMVCDATLDLNITTATSSASDVLSTGNGKITVNPQCQSHKFSLSPDYEAHYPVGAAGTYKMSLTAQTKNGSYTISDQLIVQDAVPFDVQRVSATRIYPPNDYPVQMNVTANQDFTGTVTETVPDSFTVTSSNTATTSSYTNMQTVYLDPKTNPAERMIVSVGYSHILVKGNNNSSSTVLGASTSALLLPFTGSFPITEGFGAEQTDPDLRLFYQKYGLAGHDGVDFGLPVGTPVRAVDDGTILLAGPGDYGITIVIQHSWGISYYGHLSQVSVNFGKHVSKGEQIGFSGNTGEATGPHLHFGMKPNNPDMGNGYYGKIDPLPYFNLPSSAQVADGPTIDAPSLSTVLGASTSAAGVNSQPVHDPVTAPQTVSDAVVKSDFRSLTNRLASQILNTPTTANTEKVKIITWNVSMIKGQKVSLGYTFQAPQVSPQFYLLGPLRFYDTAASGSGKPVFEETRQWQIAADRIGDPWYNNGTQSGGYSWQYRKQITIDHTKVVPTYPDATFMEPGGDATGDISIYSLVSGACTVDGAVSHTAPDSINCGSGINIATPGVNGETPSRLDSGNRTTFNFYIKTYPSADDNVLQADTSSNGRLFEICINHTTHVLFLSIVAACTTPLATGTTALSLTTWYRITVSSILTSKTVNQIKVYVNGNSTPEFSTTNQTLAGTTTVSGGITLGSENTGTGDSFNFDDVYMDNGTGLDDPGDIRVTDKRPYANGAANQFTTGIGADPGSPYGSGNAQRENERPLNIANGWSLLGTASPSENYGIEGASTGDVDLSSDNVIAYEAWIDGKAHHACSGFITSNGTNTAISLTTTALAMYFSPITMTSAYPSDPATVGMVGCTSTSYQYYLYEAGMLFAYYPTAPSQTLSNFPVLVSLPSDADLAGNALPSGGDILFTDSTGQTKYDREIEKYNSTTGELEAWVRIPSLSTSADTTLYLYYGNAAGAETNSTGVWDSNYVAVYHMNQTPPGTAITDSTTTGANGTYTLPWATYQQTTGQIDGALQFQATRSADVHFSDISALHSSSAMTMEMWFKPTTTTTGYVGNIWATNGSSQWYLQNDGAVSSDCASLSTHSTAWDFDIGAGTMCTPDGTIVAGQMDMVVGVFDGTLAAASRGKIYVDGSLEPLVTSTSFPTTVPSVTLTNWYMGDSVINNHTDGVMDEVRLSKSARSSGWVATEYNNESSPSTFYTLGSTDDVPSGSSAETKAYAPTMDQLMRHGKWFCPQSECGTTFYGKQPYVF